MAEVRHLSSTVSVSTRSYVSPSAIPAFLIASSSLPASTVLYYPLT